MLIPSENNTSMFDGLITDLNKNKSDKHSDISVESTSSTDTVSSNHSNSMEEINKDKKIYFEIQCKILDINKLIK